MSIPLTIERTFRSLRHRNFRLYATGQLISMVGTWLQVIAQSWLVYRLTGSTVLLGLIGFCAQLPVLLLSPVGGTVADRVSRRGLLMVTASIAGTLALVLSGITLARVVQASHLFVLAALRGLVNAFDGPARQAFVVEMVGKDDLPNAIALNSSLVNGARIVGPAMAGLIVASLGEGWCFALNGLSYGAVVLALATMKLAPRRAESGRRSAVAEIAGGFAFIRSNAPIRALLLLVGLVSLVAMPYVVLMPVFAEEILGGGARSMGILMGASGVGAFAGALLLATRNSVRGLGRWVAFAAAGFGVLLIAFSASRSLWLSAGLLVVAGFCVVVQMAASNTLLQTLAPDEMRGRVMAAYSMMFFGMAPFGSLLSGAAASRIGAPLTVAIGGGLSVVGAALFALRLPALRLAAREMLSRQVAGEMVEGVEGSR